MIQDKQDGLKPDETAEMNHVFSPDSDDHRGRLERPESWKKPGNILWHKHIMFRA